MITYYNSAVYSYPESLEESTVPVNWLVPFNDMVTKKMKLSAQGERLLALAKRFKDEGKGKVFLDSGAYSAYMRNFDLDLSVYMDFLRSYADYFTVYCSLDDILDPEATFVNFQTMVKEGLNPIPVWHSRENKEHYDRLVVHADYIGVGGVSQLRAQELGNSNWNSVFRNMVDKIMWGKDGRVRYPGLKVHGFGVGGSDRLMFYPWHSCDSSNVGICSVSGKLYIQQTKNGVVYAYDLPISYRNRNQKDNYYNLSGRKREYIDTILDEHGFTIDDFNEHKVGSARRVIVNCLKINYIFQYKALQTAEIKAQPPATRLF